MKSGASHNQEGLPTPDEAAALEAEQPVASPLEAGEGEAAEPGVSAGVDASARTADALQAQLADCQDKLLRARAECANISRRLRQEFADSLRMAGMPLARDLLQVLDSFDRTLHMLEERLTDDPLAQGVRLIADQLAKVLGEHGVQRMEVEIGKSFDPTRHEAMLQDCESRYPPGSVTAELAPGYLMHGRVLRAAKVAVAAEKPAENQTETPSD